MNSHDYLTGCAVLGEVIEGGGGGGHHGGGGGGHQGGGHGERGFGGGWWGGGPWWDGPYTDVDEFDEVRCVKYGPDGTCLEYRPIDLPVVMGVFDIAAEQKQMNTLKNVPVSAARELLKGGQAAIDEARSIAASKNLPGGGQRDNVYYHLKWHENELASMVLIPSSWYSGGEDLKKFVMMAFVEENAAEEGAGRAHDIWVQMWVDIGTAIAELPVEVAQGVSSAAQAVAQKVSSAVDTVETVSKWTIGIGIGLAALLGFAVYKIASGPTGQAAATAFFGRGR